MIITCPCCGDRFQVTVRPLDSQRPARADVSPITAGVYRAVLNFMRSLEPGRYTFASLLARYGQGMVERGYPEITPNALARTLRENGATRWRNATERGYDIPAIDEDQKPAKAKPSVQARVNAQSYRETLVAMSQPAAPAEFAGLPFEVEGV